MGAANMGATLLQRVKDEYPDSKSDLSTVFMQKCRNHVASGSNKKISGYNSFFTGSYHNKSGNAHYGNSDKGQ